MLTLDNIYRASNVLREVVRKTDMVYAPKLKPGVDIYLKTENLQNSHLTTSNNLDQ